MFNYYIAQYVGSKLSSYFILRLELLVKDLYTGTNRSITTTDTRELLNFQVFAEIDDYDPEREIELLPLSTKPLPVEAIGNSWVFVD